MLDLKTAQFADVYLIMEKFDLPPEQNLNGDNTVPTGVEELPNGLVKVRLGLAQNISINNNFGTTSVNVIGSPFNIPVPGYFRAELSIAKATLDYKAFTTIGNMNPLTAYLPNSYDFEHSLDWSSDNTVHPLSDLTNAPAFTNSPAEWNGKVPRFLFGLAVYDRIQDAYSRPTGIYVGMVVNIGQTLNANDAVIVQQMTAVARPVVGGWATVAQEVYNNSPFFGYSARIKKQLV